MPKRDGRGKPAILNEWSIAWRNRYGQITADGTGKELFNFVVTGNGFLAAGLWVVPNGMAATFTNRYAAMCLKMAE